jgi:hypothetical protein
MSGSSMLVATTLSPLRPGLAFSQASASAMRPMSVLAASSRRSRAISATVLPAYAGFAAKLPMSSPSGFAISRRILFASARSVKSRPGKSTVSVDCQYGYG